MTPNPVAIEDLPGGDLVAQGLRDLERGRISAESLLLIIAAPALNRLGMRLPPLPALGSDVELLLYRHLQEEGRSDPYSAYNALLRLIVSFTQSYGRWVR